MIEAFDHDLPISGAAPVRRTMAPAALSWICSVYASDPRKTRVIHGTSLSTSRALSARMQWASPDIHEHHGTAEPRPVT